MKSPWWILCALVLFISVGCSDDGTTSTPADDAPAAEEMTPDEEAGERSLTEPEEGEEDSSSE